MGGEWHDDEELVDEIDCLLLYMDGAISSILDRLYPYLQGNMTPQAVLVLSFGNFIRHYGIARRGDGLDFDTATRYAAAVVLQNEALQTMIAQAMGKTLDNTIGGSPK